MKPIPKDQTPEYQLLCRILAETQPQPDLLPQVDWSRFTRMAQFEGVAPLINTLLKQQDIPIPEPVKNELFRFQLNTLANNLLLFKELDDLLYVFDKVKIPIIALKGSSLAKTYYTNIALRPMTDIDILVRSEDIRKVTDMIRSLGYLPQKSIYHIVFKGKDKKRALLEVHWSIIGNPGGKEGLNWFWKNTISYGETASDFCLQFSPIANLLYLVSHLYLKHSQDQCRLIWLYDIHLIVEQAISMNDWDIVREQSRLFGWSTILNTALTDINDLFGTKVPDSFEYKFLDGREHRIQNDSVNKTIDSSDHKVLYHWFVDSFKLLNSRDKLYWVIGFLFPTREYMIYRYKPRWNRLWQLSYIKRFFDIFRENVKLIRF